MATDTPTGAADGPHHPAPLWTPSAERSANAVVTAFTNWLAQTQGRRFEDYEALWQWSVTDTEGFWGAVLAFFDLPLHQPPTRMRGSPHMPGADWFPGARLNLVDQVFRHTHLATPAIVYDSEAGGTGEVTWAALHAQVSSVAQTLRALGVGPGDRVVGYLPNVPQTVVAFLATASVGGVWSLCAPDMGPVSVVDRFQQIAPKVLFTVDGYRFGGKPYDRTAVVADIVAALPSLHAVVWVGHLDPCAPLPPALGPSAERPCQVVPWHEAVAQPGPMAAHPLPASHPLWILYSSGTTGLPKAIVHGHGGVLANGMVNMVLHNDLHPGDRVFWAVNTSWMVWNAHVLGLLGGATLVLYDGAVTGAGESPDWGHLWKLAARLQVNVFGAGAAIHHACMKAGIVPRDTADLSALHTVASTGSPLTPAAYHWLYGTIKPDLWLNIVAGGTDIAGGFLSGLPTLPVRLGEMQCRTLGAHVQAFNDAGEAVLDEVGELVCTQPLPSMPLRFWGDEGDVRLRESYFEHFKTREGHGIWRHGDWLRLVPRTEAVGGVIYGRSDATINRQGVRMGTAELYRVVEAIDEVLDSLVVDLEYLGKPSYMVLFVQTRVGVALDGPLVKRIQIALRQALSARHVPDDIRAVPGIPRTVTGKKLELPIKKMLLGHGTDTVLRRDMLANPSVIDWYDAFAREHLQLEAVPQAG